MVNKRSKVSPIAGVVGLWLALLHVRLEPSVDICRGQNGEVTPGQVSEQRVASGRLNGVVELTRSKTLSMIDTGTGICKAAHECAARHWARHWARQLPGLAHMPPPERAD